MRSCLLLPIEIMNHEIMLVVTYAVYPKSGTWVRKAFVLVMASSRSVIPGGKVGICGNVDNFFADSR
jgi:hypothetical protein